MNIRDALDLIQAFEDTIADCIGSFEDTEIAALISVEYPSYHGFYTTVIKVPKDISICPRCEELYDTAKGCCES